MRIQKEDVQAGLLFGATACLGGMLISRLAKGSLFAYPWLQASSSLAVATAIVLTREHKSVEPPPLESLHELPNDELGARAEGWKNDFDLVKTLTDGQLTHVFWEGVDSLALRWEMFDRRQHGLLKPPTGDWETVVSPWFEKFYTRYCALDGLPIYYLPFGPQRPTPAWRFISWLWRDSDLGQNEALNVVYTPIKEAKRDELEGKQLAAKDTYGVSDVRGKYYVDRLIVRRKLPDKIAPEDHEFLSQAVYKRSKDYWKIEANRPLLAPLLAHSIHNWRGSIGFDLFIGTVNALDEETWTRHQEKLKLRLGTLKRLMAPREANGSLGFSRDVWMTIWSFLSSRDRAAVGLVCKLWCNDVQSMLWAEDVGKDANQWVASIQKARRERLAPELASLLS
jgi:hypothetical protein